jgi:hypothetical protein
MAPHLQGGALLFGPVRGRPLWRAKRAITKENLFCKITCIYIHLCCETRKRPFNQQIFE